MVLRARQCVSVSNDRPSTPDRITVVEPGGRDGERDHRLIPIIPDVNVSQRCEVQASS